MIKIEKITEQIDLEEYLKNTESDNVLLESIKELEEIFTILDKEGHCEVKFNDQSIY